MRSFAVFRRQHQSLWETEFCRYHIGRRGDELRGPFRRQHWHFGKRNFAARDWQVLPAAKRAQISQVPSADYILSAQTFELTGVSASPETSADWQDYLVGDAGIEPATPPV
jgi:hypothetical protein